MTACEQTEQGKYNLLLAGLRRAKVETEIESVRSYRRAEVTLIADLLSEENDRTGSLGRQLATKLQHAMPAIEALLARFRQGELSLGALTDIAAFSLPLPTKRKLRLLAEANVAARGRLLLSSLQVADSGPEKSRPGFPADFSSN